MFEEISGLPVHPLVVHAAVVFIPLLAVAGVVYALVPKVRSRIGWAVVLLAIGAPIAAFVAKQSGEELLAARYPDQVPPLVDDHQGYAGLTLWFSLGLGAAALLLVLATSSRARRAPSWLGWVLSAAVIVLAGFTGYYVFKTGDTGASSVWGA